MPAELVRVLLVDDDEDDFVLVRALLAKAEGVRFQVDWLAHYEQALAQIQQDQHDVYLLDFRLGLHNGLELLRVAIAQGCTAPIILLTGQGDHGIDVEAMKAGAADYLDKSQIIAPLLERSIRYAIERKQAEQKIREQAHLLDIATDAIHVRSLDNQVLYWNKGAERIYGWLAEEVIGRDASQFLYQSPSMQLTDIHQILLQQGSWQGELCHLRKDGRELVVESRWTLVRDRHQQPKSILVVNTDITTKKQLEVQFLRTQRLESIGTLAGGIAHDLNNILAPVLMAVQLLRTRYVDDQAARWLSTLELSVKRAADLIKQVLSFSRGIEGERRTLQVAHLIAEIEHLIRETFPKAITIHLNISARDLWLVLGDATQIQQVLMNLCVNARDAMSQGGTLKIMARNVVLDEAYVQTHLGAKIGSYVLIEIADTGTGIPPHLLDRIFEPFFTTKALGTGTGLGLSTVMGIVNSHGGFLQVDSQIGQGTCFQVYLPTVETAVIEPELDDSHLFLGEQELILVVDDEATIREMTRTTLEIHGYRVLTAATGEEAIALYSQQSSDISLVLIDMMMPGLDGCTAIQALEALNPQVSIIAVSGLATNGSAATSASLRVKRFLSKPYSARALLQAIHQILHESPVTSSIHWPSSRSEVEDFQRQ